MNDMNSPAHMCVCVCVSDNDTCIEHECVNGATCKQILGGYTCGPCPEGFAGLYCQRGWFVCLLSAQSTSQHCMLSDAATAGCLSVCPHTAR